MAEKPKSSAVPDSGTVTVACNIANGLVLQLYDMEDGAPIPVLGGGTRIEKVAVAVGEPVTIFGPALAKGATPKCLIASGYALTPNVDAQFMRKWMNDNKSSMMVKNDCVMVYAVEKDARAAAKDRGDFRSGLEPLTPGLNDKGQPLDRRLPKRRTRQIGAVGSADIAA